MADHPALAGLPGALFALAGELAALAPPDEPRADCARCPVAALPGAPPSRARPFLRETRCCTFHPRMPNFLLGRALDGPGAARVEARIALAEGVSAMGIEQAETGARDYRARMATAFGRDPALRCPYWVGGDLACGIWADRGAVCRTWHCLHGDGPRGRAFWRALQDVLELCELLLARACVDAGQPPESGPPQVWSDWYRWCARRVETLDGAAWRTPALEALLADLAAAHRAHLPPLPDRVGPRVRRFERADGRVLLAADSDLDTVELPDTAFVLLSLLDGTRTWQQALAEANAALEIPFEPAVIQRLWRAGLLEPRGPGPPPTARIRRGGRTVTLDDLPTIRRWEE